MITRKLVGSDPNISWVMDNYRNKIGNFYQLCLPLDYCYFGKPDTISFHIRAVIKRFFEWLDAKKIQRIIDEGHYDYIYLSSLTLHHLVRKSPCTLIHIREIFDNSNDAVFESLKIARGVIFIDAATAKPFEHLHLGNAILLNNPFWMHRRIENVPYALRPNIDQVHKTVFSIIGRIEEIKGVDFVIESFRKVPDDNIILLIVGSGEKGYLSRCKSVAGDDKRIVFYGNESDIQLIYDISDYIIRGDPHQCIGRTIYEGLYSGCHVIIPGSETGTFFEFEKFREKIHFYQPKNTSALTRVIHHRARQKITERIYYSNVPEYIEKFNEFIAKVSHQ